MGRKAAEDVDDERGLLLELARGKKTFEQVAVDARRLVRKGADLSALTGSNAARCITQRLQELTGISKDSLHFFDVRCKPGTADPGLAGEKMKLPFILLSTHISGLAKARWRYRSVFLSELQGIYKSRVGAALLSSGGNSGTSGPLF